MILAANTLLSSALAHHQAGRLAQAADFYHQVLAASPDQPDALHLLGVIDGQMGRAPDAIEKIKRAIAQREEPSYYNNLGNMLLVIGEKEEAQASFERAIALQPSFADAHFNLGNLLAQSGQKEQAVQSFRQAIFCKPDYVQAYQNLGVVLGQLHDDEGAAQAFRQALVLAPQNSGLLNNLASSLMKSGNFKDSEGFFDQALRLKPQEPSLLFNQALLFFAQRPMKEWDAVIECYAQQAAPHAGYLYEMAVRGAIRCWVCGEREKLPSVLQLCKERRLQLQGKMDHNSHNMQVYETFIGRLLNEPALPQEEEGKERLTLPVIGDSHVLSYVGVTVRSGDKIYDAKPELMVGCKAWHLAQPVCNAYQASFEKVLERVPTGSLCLLSFGEIDCRAGEGFLPYHRKSGGDLSSQVVAVVDAYVAWTGGRCQEKGLIPLYVTAPAPSPLLSLSVEEKEAVGQVVDLFNKALFRRVAEQGQKTVDIGTLTQESGQAYHIDAHHLKPACVQKALVNAFLCR